MPYQIFTNNRKVFVMSLRYEAERLCKIMNSRNDKLKKLRDNGIDSCCGGYNTEKRVWTYEKLKVWDSIEQLDRLCPLVVEPKLEEVEGG